MQKKLQKRGAILLSIIMLFSILTACGSSDKSSSGNKASDNTASNSTNAASDVKKDGFPIVSKPITLTMLAQSANMGDWSKMPVVQEMEKLSNVKIEFQTVPIDSFATKKNLVFASGDLPDMIYAADLKPSEQVTYGTQGAIIPLEKLIDNYAPNLKKLLDENPNWRKNITTSDGHIYSLPFFDAAAVWYRGPMWYNGKFLKALNATEPKTTEELYTYLKRIKTEDPNGNGKADEIPLCSVKLDDLRMFFLGFWGIYNEELYADKDGKMHYTPQEEGYKGYLTFLNRLWKEDLLDHETFSQNDDQKKAKGKENRLGLFSDYMAYFTLGGEQSTSDPMMTPVSSEIPGSPVYGKHPGMSANGAFAITKHNPNPEATMRWIDYQFGYDGATLWNQGPEGNMWKYKDKATHTKEWLPVPGGGDREEYRATITPNYGILTPGVNLKEMTNGLRTPFDDWIDQQNQQKLVPIGKVPMPNVYLSNDEQSQVTALLSDLETYTKQMEAKFVTGQEPLSNWDKYVAQLKKMGSDDIVKIYQAAYDRWNQEGAK